VDAAAVAVVREGHVVVPKEDTVFAAGDEVLVVTSEGSEGRVRELLVGEAPDEPGEDDEPDEDDEEHPQDGREATEEPAPAEPLQ
jgi:NhaP-type Na+/H+ and K+/H+ antiporter